MEKRSSIERVKTNVDKKTGDTIRSYGYAGVKVDEDDFRSVNGQIGYLLSECVRQRRKNGRPVPNDLDEPPEFDIE